MTISFVKGHGTENDFVLLPDVDGRVSLTPELVARICDRHTGVGGDGVLRVVRDTSGVADWFMDYRNADGSVAEMCGNGVRVFARYLVCAGLAEPGDFPVATRGGVKHVRLGADGDVTVDMGVAKFPPTDGIDEIGEIKVTVGDRSWPAVAVDLGNPHAVVLVDDLAQAGSLREPPLVDPAFPEGVNVEFVTRRGDSHLAMRVYERGVGETRSCGTGACAAMLVAASRAQTAAPTTYVVDVLGGRLTVTQRKDDHVELTGPAVLVASGELSDGFPA